MKKRLLALVILLIILISAIWSAKQQFVVEKGVSITQERVCAELVDLDNFIRACPSSAQKPGLQIAVKAVYFEALYKCSISVYASDTSTLYIVADVFKDPQKAYNRMRERTSNTSNGKFYEYIESFGNLLGLGEISALDATSNARNLLLLKGKVYAEIVPSGGGFCPKSELMNLGRLIYERMPQL